MVSRHREESPGYRERSGLKRFLADAITIDGRTEWMCKMCKFCSETNVWTRCRCRRCFSNILAGLQRKHMEAVFARVELGVFILERW